METAPSRDTVTPSSVRARVEATLDEIETVARDKIATAGEPVRLRCLLDDLTATYRVELVSRSLTRSLSHKRLRIVFSPTRERMVDVGDA